MCSISSISVVPRAVIAAISTAAPALRSTALTGAPVHACDLRAGAAMVIAGLAAQGTTEIDGVYHIERGYETLVEKLSGVGAKIQVLVLPDDEAQTQAG